MINMDFDSLKNPFNPRHGRVPKHFIGRKDELDRLDQAIAAITQSEPPAPVVPYGPRGNGKTALMRRLGHDRKADFGKIAISGSGIESAVDVATATIRKHRDIRKHSTHMPAWQRRLNQVGDIVSVQGNIQIPGV